MKSGERAESGERRRAEFGCEVLQQQQLQRVKAPIRGEDKRRAGYPGQSN